MGQRTCFFCGSDGPLTKEDVIPLWLVGVLKDIEPDELAGQDWETHYTKGGLVEENRQYPVKGRFVATKSVCGPCKSGWMSALEGAAKKLLEPMIRGQRVTLEPAQQIEVATWASKAVMAMETHEPTTVVAAPQDRECVRTLNHPPAHHRTRISYRSEVNESLIVKTLVASTEQGSDATPNAFSTLLAMGFLVIHVWGGPGVPDPAALQREGTKIGNAIMLWPPVPNPVGWPPVRAVEEEDLDEFAHAAIPWAHPSPSLEEWRSKRHP